MTDIVQQILGDVNWSSSYAIPVANDKNKRLIQEVESFFQNIQCITARKCAKCDQENVELEQIKRQTQSVQDEFGTLHNRVEMMKSHRDQVTIELQEIQQIYASHCLSLETTENIISVMERERGRIGSDLRKLKTGVAGLKEKQTSFENTALKKNLEIESAKRNINVDAQTLEVWMSENERKSDDIVAINKYRRIDDVFIKELSLSLDKVTTERHRKNNLLAKGRVELEMQELSIEKMAQAQRDALKERQGVLVQWEKTVEHCGNREKEVEKLSKHYSDLLDNLNSNKARCREKTAFLTSQKENNREAERKIEHNEKVALRLKLGISGIRKQIEEMEKEMKSLKFGIDRRVSDLESAKMEISRMKEMGAENRKRLEELAQQCDLLKQRLAIITDSKLTAEQMVHEAEKQLQQEENYKAELTRILVSLRKEHYEITNTLRTVTEEKVLTQIKIDSSISALKNLHATVSKLNEETRRQQDIKYNLSLQIESMERRIAPLQDDVNEEQIAALKEQIQARTKELEMQTAIQKTLSNQLVQVQTDVLHCQRSIASLKKEYDAVEYRMSTDELYVDQTQKALDLAEKEKNNMLVEENMLRLQLTRLTRLLDNHNEQVFDLEKQRLQLKVFANERELDLKMYMDNLRSELNINAEEKSRLSIELQSKKMQVGKTRNRFEIASVKLAPPEGEEAHSQAYYIIKASQQRSALKAQGDQLDREIAQGVKELEALENTLSVMNGCNRNYRQSHMEVPEDSELSITKQELEEALKLSLLTGAIKRRHNTELRSKCKEYLESSAGVEAELANLNNAERLLTEKAELREKELKSLQERLVRAQRCMKKAKATARETTKLEAHAWEHFSDDIKVRLIGELFDNLVALIFRGIKVATNELAQERAQIYLSAAGFPTSARTQRSGPTPSSLSLTGSCHSLASLTSSLSSSARSDAMMTGSHVTSPASSQSSIASVNSPPRGSGSLRSVDMSSRVSFPGEGGTDSRSE